MIGDEVAGAGRLLAAYFAQTQVGGSRELELAGLWPGCSLWLRSGWFQDMKGTADGIQKER
jgi:hypothetical protein